MAGISIYPDGDYEHGATWVNANDRVAWQRTFAQGTAEQQEMAKAMITANPGTPATEIRANMTAPFVTQRGMKTSMTLDDVLKVGAQGFDPGHLYDRAPTDFSGTPAGMEASSFPSLGGY